MRFPSPATDRSVRSFICVNPVQVVMHRPVATSDGAGGVTKVEVAVLAQQMRMLDPTARVSGVADRVDADGRVIRRDGTLVGYPGADVRKGDRAVLEDGRQFRVVSVSKSPAWRTTAEVEEIG